MVTSVKTCHFPSHLTQNQDLSRLQHETWAEYAATNATHGTNPNLFGKQQTLYYAVGLSHLQPLTKRESSIITMKRVIAYVRPNPNYSMSTLPWTETSDEKPNKISTYGLTHRIHKSHLNLKYHKYGNKPGKLLAKLCKGNHTPTHILLLKDTQGTTASSSKGIIMILERYYASLYGEDLIDIALLRLSYPGSRSPDRCPSFDPP